MASKKTLVVGASTNPERYAFKAITQLRNHQHEIIAYGRREGTVADVEINTQWDTNWKVDTVTLYIGPAHQGEFMNKIVDLHPNRVVFNPGTENTAFFDLLHQNGIQYEEACTLVLLATDQY